MRLKFTLRLVFSSEIHEHETGDRRNENLTSAKAIGKMNGRNLSASFYAQQLRESVDTMEFQVYSFLSRGSFPLLTSYLLRVSPSNEPTLNEMRHYNTPGIKCDRFARSFYLGRMEEFFVLSSFVCQHDSK